MALDIIVTTGRWRADPASRDLVEYLQKEQGKLCVDEATLYYDFPAYADYEASIVRPDVLIYSPSHGFIAIRVYSDEIFRRSNQTIGEIDISLDDFMGNLHGKLVRSRILRKSGTQTVVPIHPIILCSNEIDASDVFSATAIKGIEGLEEFLNKCKIPRLEDRITGEVRSVVEGAKALSRPTKRPGEANANKPLVAALNNLEGQIANFDQKQRHIALVDVGGPARIRGLAGSGKTIILAMKAAHLHLNDRNARILITFYTKSLRTTLKSLITKFYRVYSDVDPDWKMIHIRHGWGGSKIPGVYSDACERSNISPLTLAEARSIAGVRETAFEAACRNLLDKATVQPFYDHVLIDEGQDFPSSFYQLAYEICQGDRDKEHRLGLR